MLYDIILEPVFRFIFTLPPPTPGLMIQYLSQRYLLLKNLAEELNFGSVCIHHFYLLYDTNIATLLINYHFKKRNQGGKTVRVNFIFIIIIIFIIFNNFRVTSVKSSIGIIAHQKKQCSIQLSKSSRGIHGRAYFSDVSW